MSTDFILQAKNCPNPFNRETDIAYTLNAPANVQIQIYNSAGQVVQSFDRGIQQPGTYNVHWDGTYGNGTLVTSGVYFYQIKAGTQTISKPMILLTLK
jgi:flagellar hook assembly protein FlgD